MSNKPLLDEFLGAVAEMDSVSTNFSKEDAEGIINMLARVAALGASADEERKASTYTMRNDIAAINEEYGKAKSIAEKRSIEYMPKAIESLGKNVQRGTTARGAKFGVANEVVSFEIDKDTLSLNTLMKHLTDGDIDMLVKRALKKDGKVRGVTAVIEKRLKFYK